MTASRRWLGCRPDRSGAENLEKDLTPPSTADSLRTNGVEAVPEGSSWGLSYDLGGID